MAELRRRPAPLPCLPVRPVIRRAARLFGVTAAEVEGARRWRELLIPRQAVVLVALDLSERSLPEIGRALGGRDHSTVVNLRDGGVGRYRRDARFRQMVRRLREDTLRDPWGRESDLIWALEMRRLAERDAARQAEEAQRAADDAEWRELLKPERTITACQLNGPELLSPAEITVRRMEAEAQRAAHVAFWLAREKPPLGRRATVGGPC